jgi:hypothetical protein
MSPDDVLAPLSSLYDDDDARRAARRLLAAPDPGREVERLYPALLAHHTLPPALAHLERAGADLERLTIPTALFRATPRLNAILPAPDECAPGRVSLAGLRRRMEAHSALVRRALHDVLDLDADGRLIVLFGRAVEGLCPDYARLPRPKHDVDVFAPDLRDGLQLLNGAWEKLGFEVQGCRTCPADDGWITHLALYRVSKENHVLRIDLLAGGRPIDPSLWFAPRRYPQLAARSRWVDWDGRRMRVPSPEDVLLMLAEKARMKPSPTLRDFGDARFLLARLGGQLDWDYLTAAAHDGGLGASVYVLAREAERREARKLVPPRVLTRLAPGRLERLLFPAPAGNGRPPRYVRKLWAPFCFAQQVAARLARPRAAVRLLLDQLRPRRYLDRAVEAWAELSPTQLVLDNTRVTDAGLARLRNATRLQTLSLGGTVVTDAGLEHLRGLTQLQRLYLHKTLVTDAGLAHLRGLGQLRELRLDGSAVTEAGVEGLRGALPQATIEW